jgi:hypothetical protein
MESKLNNTNSLLNANETWVGTDEVCNGSTIILVNIISSEDCIITVKQTDNRTNYPFIQTINYYAIATQSRYQIYTNSFYCHVEVQNIGANPINLVLRTHFLDIGKDYSIIDPLPVVGDVVVSSIVAPLPAGSNNIGLVTITADTSSVQTWVQDTASGDYFILSSTAEVRDALTYHKLETYDYTANNTLTSIDSKVGLQGQNTDFAFFPDATNLTPAIYADGQQPVATNQAGWVYTNNGVAPNKINWYVFQDVTLPQYLVSEMDSIYFVISQLTPATTLPFVSFYTMPNGIDDVVPNFAKSKLVFAPSGAVPTAQGQYLFYVKSDPTHIRPEITNRYELTFSVANSSKTLEQASGERLSLATLSTNSTDPAGSNYFLFQQYGITWAKTSVPLPVNNGKVECNITLQPVTLTTGTADIGFVNIKAEDRNNAGSLVNLVASNEAAAGFNLLTKDEEAILHLYYIRDYTEITSEETTLIRGYNANMDTNLGIIKNSNNGIETLTDSINQKITACNTGAVVLATGSADIGNVSIQGDDSGVPRKLSALENGGLYALQTNDITGNFWLDTINTFLISNLSRLPITGNYAEIVIQNYTNISLFGGYVYSLNVYSNGSSGINFIKLYGITNATNASTPLIIIPVPHGESVNLSLGGLKCLTGISVRATANYVANDNTAPTNLISCSLTFSALL